MATILESSAPSRVGRKRIIQTFYHLSTFYATQTTWQSADGRIFFGGGEGLTAFCPDQITPDPYKPPIVLTELYLFHEPVEVEEGGLLDRSIWATDHLTLEPDHTSVSFEFAALSYIAPQENRYRYILEGIDEAWTEADSDQRMATYTYLPPGDYVFRVQGATDDDVWSSDEATLSITVLPHWWETWWFRVVLVGLVVGLVAAGVRWRPAPRASARARSASPR
jgi:hypothetical protein